MSDAIPEQIALDVGHVFTPAVPVSESDLFAGRANEIRRIIDAINHRGQHAVIFGERGVGKTSLANVVSSRLKGNVPILVAHVTCNATDDFTSLWRQVLQNVELVQPRRRQPGFHSLAILEETRAAAEVLRDDLSPDDLRRLLTLIGHEKILIIVFDEFDRIEDPLTCRAIADTIKTFSDHAVPATVIVVGVADTIDDLISQHESIERVLVQVQMPRMEPGELVEILRRGTERLKMTIDDDAAQFVARLSQGLPHYTHLIGLHAARTALAAGARGITVAHIAAAIDKAVSDSQQSLRSGLRSALSSPQQGNIFGAVLLACALARTDEFGYFGTAEVRDPLSRITGKPYEVASFAKHLTALCLPARGRVLEKSGVKQRFRYRFTNALMPSLIIMKGLVDGTIDASTLEDL
jgi:Cdc6-like AAA superfamily ATPase